LKTISAKDLPNTASLSSREREIYDLLGHGLDKHLIAQELGLRVKTVESHRESIKSKLQLASSRDLVRLAVSSALHAARSRATTLS
jgi:DNA-binding NarL/FixJ family response regulator